MPAPDGSIDLRLTGANTLIDKLVEMGLVQDDQAMSARMAMGMVLKSAEGEDALEGTIAVTPDGKVIANGQRLR